MEPKEISETILKTLEKGWNSANGAEFSQPFADTSEFVDIRGTLHKHSSKKYIAEAHQGLFMSVYKDSKISYQFIQAMHLDSNTILVNASTELDAPAGPLAGKNSSTITMVLTKSVNSWVIRAFHNTLVLKK